MSGLDFDGLLLDLDGCVYTGRTAVPGAARALNGLAEAGVPVVFLTNNASRSARQVADHITELGVDARPEQVLTSGIVAARELARTMPAGAPVLVVGSEALADQVRDAGLSVVTRAADDPVAVVQGHSPDTGWRQLAEICTAVRAGAEWWATNLDRTFPTEAGLLPGNGSFVRVVQETTGATPQVAGKPAASMMRAGTDLLGAARPLMVGDRLETDIAGARAAGITAGLVLTGVHREEDARAAPAEERPHMLLDSLLDLLPDGIPRRFA